MDAQATTMDWSCCSSNRIISSMLVDCTTESLQRANAPCPLYALTGVYFPICGASRAVYSLTHGHLTAAFSRNPLFVVSLPLLVWLWSAWMSRTTGGPDLGRFPSSKWLKLGVVLLVVGYGVARNMPWPALHILGPKGPVMSTATNNLAP